MDKKLDLSVIILTYNEEIHIRRVLENVCDLALNVFVIDCFSTDSTVAICDEFENVTVVKHEWPGNQAAQFNWALDTLNVQTNWVLRLDADEYLSGQLKEELYDKLPGIDSTVSAIALPLGRVFMGKELKHGASNNIKMIRLFRYGKVRYENRIMDEHLEVLSGEIVEFKNRFYDDNKMPIGFFVTKHNNYASREAAMLLDAEYHLFDSMSDNGSTYFVEIEKKEKINKSILE